MEKILKNKILFQRAALLVFMLLLSACASKQPLSAPEIDPWEPMNRSVFAFNAGFDKVLYRPISSGYNKVVPGPIKEVVGNMLDNLASPGTIINLLLQGRIRDAWVGTKRFVINSTVGIFGALDVASSAEIPLYDEDFGQTLAVWGWNDSRYLMLPFLGPSTIRDAGGRVGNGYIEPISYMAAQKNIWAPWVLEKAHVRIALMAQEEIIESSNDVYIMIRDVWLQNREFDIYNGDPPLPDYEALLEE